MVPASRSSNEHEEKKTKSGAEDSEDESEILEESPCGRWLKRREEVQQRDVPGIDAAYLAMDTEEGVEVVWNEVRFSERKNFKAQEEKIRQVFDNLTQLEHPNIVKFHKYWIDSRDEKPRVIFITEYMSSGSLKQFLKRTKRNVKKPPLQSWKRWCTQILSALSYLHSCSPPIVHGNLTCDTIFIQHNGLIKIGSVAPDAIHQHVKTCRDNVKNTHFIAPEFGTILTPAVDIYSFGMCALEMGALEIHGNGDSGTVVTEEHVQRTIATLEVPVQKDLVGVCLKTNPEERPSAKELLFHKAIFELPSLRLLAAHIVVRIASNISETISDEAVQRHYGPGVLVAEVIRKDGTSHKYHSSDIPVSEKLEKFMEDVKFGIYPLPTLSPPALVCPGPRPRAISPETAESVASDPPEPVDTEARRVTNMICDVKPRDEGSGLVMTLLLRMDDKMNRQLSCIISESDSAIALAEELVHYGFINAVDKEKIAQLINNSLSNCLDRNENGDCREKIEAISHMPLPVSIAS